MASVATNRIIDEVSLTCPGSMEGILLLEYYNVLKEFFDRSNCWLFEMVVNVVPSMNDYILNTCQNAAVNRLINVRFPRVPPPSPPIYLPMDPPQYLASWTTQDNQGINEAVNSVYNTPRDAVLLRAGDKCPIMRLVWNPAQNQIWIATLALSIIDPMDTEGLPSVPDWIISKYHEYIAGGLKSRLMLQPGKPYSSTAGAQFHGRKFNEGIGLARKETRDLFTFSAQRWLFPQGWTVRRPKIS